MEGNGPWKIAEILRDEKVDRPSCYLAHHGRGTQKNTVNWRGNTVGAILSKQEYMGHTVNFRSHKESYKDKCGIKKPPEEWLIFENPHEGIIDPETWALAQQVKKIVRRMDGTGVASPLNGHVYCADCGSKMSNHRGIARFA